jgi:hypothetical protein
MTFEFKAAVLSNGQIALPAGVAAVIPPGRELSVTLTLETPVQGDSFSALGKKLSEGAYTPEEDSVYDAFA